MKFRYVLFLAFFMTTLVSVLAAARMPSKQTIEKALKAAPYFRR